MSEQKSKFQRFWARYGGTGFVVSVAIHGTLLLAAAIWVVNEYVINPQREMQAPPPKEQSKTQKQIDFTIQTERRQRMPSRQMEVKRIAVANSSDMQLPETPDLPGMTFGGGFNTGAGAGGVGGFGGNVGTGGSGPVVKLPPFGFDKMTQGGAFVGNLYDLKQSPAGKLIEPRTNFVFVVRDFFNSNWNRNQLRRFYKAPQNLYAVQFYVPWMNAIEAPRAFKAEEQIAPSMWLALYEGRVSPPSSGRYRFIGAADDLVAVRFNKRLVLSAYWGDNPNGSIAPSFSPSGFIPVPSIQKDNRIPGFPKGFVCGEWMNLDANQMYEMEVLLGERPGGQYWGYLFVEKEGVPYKKNSKGDPELSIFRVRRGITSPSEDPRGWSAPFEKESPVWRIY